MLKSCMALVIVMVVSGCATIFTGGGSQQLTFKSVPDAATLTVTNRDGINVHTGTTPATLRLSRSAGYFQPQRYTVTIAKAGFKTQTVSIGTTVEGWYFGNILAGGAIGMLIVDPLTGAMFRLTPRNIAVVLEPSGVSAASDNRTLTIMLAQDVPPGMWKYAVQIGSM